MKQKQRFISFLLAWLMVATFGYAIALPQLQDDKKKTHTSTAQPVQLDEDTIPDSLLHTRWQIQRTQPYSLSDLYQSPLDLKRPDNLQYQVVYNDTLDRYIIGNRKSILHGLNSSSATAISASRTMKSSRQKARRSSISQICTSTWDLLRKSSVLVASE